MTGCSWIYIKIKVYIMDNIDMGYLALPADVLFLKSPLALRWSVSNKKCHNGNIIANAFGGWVLMSFIGFCFDDVARNKLQPKLIGFQFQTTNASK